MAQGWMRPTAHWWTATADVVRRGLRLHGRTTLAIPPAAVGCVGGDSDRGPIPPAGTSERSHHRRGEWIGATLSGRCWPARERTEVTTTSASCCPLRACRAAGCSAAPPPHLGVDRRAAATAIAFVSPGVMAPSLAALAGPSRLLRAAGRGSGISGALGIFGTHCTWRVSWLSVWWGPDDVGVFWWVRRRRTPWGSCGYGDGWELVLWGGRLSDACVSVSVV